MIGYKGFDKNFCCQDFQFEVGKTYNHYGRLKLCESGFHFCTNPLAVFQFYPPTNGNRYALVEATGKIIEDDDGTYKACTDEIKIVRELSIDEMILVLVKGEKLDANGDLAVVTKTSELSAVSIDGDNSVAVNTGDYSEAISDGYKSVAVNTGNYSTTTSRDSNTVSVNTGVCSVSRNIGDFSIATNTGNFSTAITSGEFSISSTVENAAEAKATGNNSTAVSTGRASRAIVSGERSIAVASGPASSAKGAIGSWLVLGEWNSSKLIDVQAFKVDGKIIKPNTFYHLKDGKPVAVDD